MVHTHIQIHSFTPLVLPFVPFLSSAMASPRILQASLHHGSNRHDDDLNQSFSDVFFGFLDDENNPGIIVSPESYGSSSTHGETTNELFDEHDEEEEEQQQEEKDNMFWENQHQLLQATLRRTSSLESGIRNVTKQVIKEMQISGTSCGCGRPVAMAAACQICLMREVSARLRNDGYNSAVCKSKWRSSPDIPSGEHTFLDVLGSSSSKKGEVRVIIELNFRAEFEMARASEEYNRLVQKLPEVFVGKVERLHNVIKIMCSAAKKCMREKKMHMGPWRKHRYMQAKWLGACQRRTASSSLPLSTAGDSEGGRLPRPRVKAASMLTVDLLDVMPNMHCKAVAVV